MRANQVVFHKVIHKFSTTGRTSILLLGEFADVRKIAYRPASTTEIAYTIFDTGVRASTAELPYKRV